MSRVDPLDLFAIEADLGDDDRLVKDSVGRFVNAEVLPIMGRCFAEHRFPGELIPGLASLGLLGATIEGYGCAGLGKRAYGLVCQELERGDSSLRSFVSVQTSLVMGCIAQFGSEEQRARWLPAMAAGHAIGCFGLTESHGGSDPSNMRTRARQQGSDWVLNGSKHWITNGAIADVAIVWASTTDGIGAFLVHADSPGFTRREIPDKLSLRASSTGELGLADVRVPESDRLPGVTGLKSALSCLDSARFGIAFGAVGAAEACLDEALAYAGERELFGGSLAGKQLVQQRLADAARRLSAAKLIAHRLADLAEAGRMLPTQVSLAKWNNVRAALDIARECRDLLGAAGITVEHAVMRHMLNLESVVTYEGTETIHTLVVGRALTDVSAF